MISSYIIIFEIVKKEKKIHIFSFFEIQELIIRKKKNHPSLQIRRIQKNLKV